MKLPKIRKKIWIPALLLILIVGFLVVRSKNNQPEYLEYSVESRSMEDLIELSGKLNSASSASLRFAAGGLVTYVGAKEGDTVKKWQTLASIDTRQLQKVLEQKLNLYAIQRGTFEDTQDDYRARRDTGDVDATLRRLLEKNQYQLDNTVKDVEYQDLSLRLARIYSPVNGILIHAPISVSGSQAAATDTWIVVDPKSLEFVADLDETELSRVKVGQKVRITLDAYPDDVIESVISSISYAPKETTTGTTYEVTVKIPEDKMSMFRLGLNGTASIITNEKQNVQVLPNSAITLDPQGSLVYVKSGSKYESRLIKTGIDNSGYVEILEGLSEGQVVYAKKVN